MTNRYENVFILTPVLSDKQTKEATKKIKDFIKKHDGKVLHEEHWGLRKLAYPIQKKTTGFYHLVEFEAEGEVIDKLERIMKRDEKILRYLTVKMDKDAIEWAEKRKEKRKNAKEGKKDTKTKGKKEEVSSE